MTSTSKLTERSVFSYFQVDESLPRNEMAHSAWNALVAAKKSYDALFLVIGKLLKIVRDQELYKELDYENFSQLLESEEVSFSREKAYMYIKVYEYYVETLQLSEETVGSINVSRLSMMVPVLKQIEDRSEIVEKIDEMSKMRHGDFVREIRQQTNRRGKPEVYWSEEQDRWVVKFYDNRTILQSMGDL